MKKKNKKLVKMGLWLALGIGMVLLFKLGKKERENRKLDSMAVWVSSLEGAFVDVEEIKKEVIDFLGDSLHKIEKHSLNISHLEERLLSNPFVRDAQVFCGATDKLHINIWQRKPIMRVINSKAVSYYVDNHGEMMPLSNSYTARVMVATGHIIDSGFAHGAKPCRTMQDLIALGSYLYEEEPLQSMIEQINVKPNGDFELVPVFGSHKVLLGSLEGLDGKVEKLLDFYQQTKDKTSWDQYAQLNLKFEGQVVCTKK